MKLFSLLALGAAFAIAAANPQLRQVNRVYILAMGGGLDQFLANQLTKYSVFQVVTDPQKADAIVTDRVGESFETKLKDLYAPPKPAGDTKKEASKEAADAAPPERPANQDKLSGVDISGGPRVGGFGRGRGNIFIVDRGTHAVLWSVYERPKDSTPGELDKTAQRVVKRLKNDLEEKKPADQ